ncbi:MAG TPA: hypothetical protein VGS09_04250 [Actinomycetota bacterium]|jgi:hypothetical protein|nr:hypothetical protein [Actinomycetota bacterium]
MLRGRTSLRLALLTLLAALIPQPASAAEVRWVAYVRAEEPFFPGSLHVVQSNGAGARTLAENVMTADLGPGGTVFAIHQEGEDFTTTSVTRISPKGRARQLLPSGGTLYLSLAAAARGAVAIQRFVTRGADVPSFLRDAIPVLASTEVPILTPPEKPAGPVELSTVAESRRRSYQLMFTNDPEGQKSHAEQFNVFVGGRKGSEETPADATEVEVRGTTGSFFCGASTCFLSWEENGSTYSVGEFGAAEDAGAFAESLVQIEEVAGSEWRFGGEIQAPELVTLRADGSEEILESVEGFCECGFQPVSWEPDDEALLVIRGAEGFTELVEYPAGGGEPKTLAQGDLGGMILDAAYGPEGVLLLRAGELGPPGTVETLDGEIVAERILSFDVAGSTLVYATGSGRVVVRNLTNGRERTVGRGAVDVSVSPDAIPAPPQTQPPVEAESSNTSPLLWVALALAALALLGGGLLLGARLRSR